jgi:hypothetical protein
VIDVDRPHLMAPDLRPDICGFGGRTELSLVEFNYFETDTNYAFR